MAYNSSNKKPFEYASKINHSAIINSSEIKLFLEQYDFVSFDYHHHKLPQANQLYKDADCEIKQVCSIDGSYLEVNVDEKFPSRKLAYFNIGYLIFDYLDYSKIKGDRIVNPKLLKDLEESSKVNFLIPILNMKLKNEESFLDSIRITLHNYFKSKDYTCLKIYCLYDVMQWLLFEEWNDNNQEEIMLEKCPLCGNSINISFSRKEITHICPNCNKELFLIDVLRFNEIINEINGASGIMGYLCNLLEQFIMFELIMHLMQSDPDMLREILFIKDGTLAFFGQTFRFCAKARNFFEFCYKNNILINVVGLEKSGSFVDHIQNVENKMIAGAYYILNEDYIRKYIVPMTSNTIYGFNTYYGKKVAYKNENEDVIIADIPVYKYSAENKREDFIGIDRILSTVGKMRCNLYDNSVVPISIINKLISLSVLPGQKMLEKFSKDVIKK